MKVILSMVMTGEVDRTIPPNSLLVLASVLEAHGHEVDIVFPVQLMDYLENPEGLEDCDVFGLSANSFNWFTTRSVIERVHRANPRATIILGGPHPTYLAAHCLETTSAHVVFRGEAERSLPAFLDALAGGESLAGVDGITYKDEAGEIRENRPARTLSVAEMNALPLSAFDKIPAGLYDFVPVETSRGCFFSCSFCALPFPQSLRVFTMDRLRATLSMLRDQSEKFPAKGIFITDDSFSANRKHAKRCFGLLHEIVPDFKVSIEARISEILGNELLDDFEATKLSMLQIGVESGYEEGLVQVSKDLSLEAVREFAGISASRSFRHQLLWSYIIGFPWEREPHILKTINFAFDTAAISGSPPPQVNNFAPYPGTPMVVDGDRFGMEPIPPDYYDHADWFSTFLRLTKLSPQHASFLYNYLNERKRIYPAPLDGPYVYLPDGRVLDNAALQYSSPHL